MSTPGYYLKEHGERSTQPLTPREIAALPPDSLIFLHTHMNRENQFANLIKRAEKHGGEFAIKPYRTARLKRGFIIAAPLHEDRVAMDYPVVLKGEPKVIHPEDGRGKNGGRKKRKKEFATLPNWLSKHPIRPSVTEFKNQLKPQTSRRNLPTYFKK